MDAWIAVVMVICFAMGSLFGYNLYSLRKARVGLMVKFPQPSEESNWKPEDVAGAIIMFSEPVTYMGVEWYDRFGDVIHSEFLNFSDSLPERG